MIAESSEEKMMAYLQSNLLHERPELKINSAQVSFIYDHKQKIHVARWTADYPGLPLIVKGHCKRSCLIALGEWFCEMSVKSEAKVHPMLGIRPRFVVQMEEFKESN